MPRQPRFVLIGQPQHVIIRGNNREPVFYADDDYRFYLEKLKLACDKHACDVHAYVLMTNHIHLLITPHKEDGLAKAMQMIGRYYVQYFNKTYQRTGTLWEGRYKATLIDSEAYALTCYRYIEMNPVRAQGMADHPAAYPWSSYRANALGEANPLLVPHWTYEHLGNTPPQRQHAYRELFTTLLDTKALNEIREATNKSWVLGSDYFKEKIAAELDRPVAPAAKGGDRKSKQYQAMKTNRV
ncbi:MAG: transposase [Candidatus Thiothrix putei]|uniref:Transposase n=1 Tax=Candidatus Thiothrix putei TaxID=3080811 RepID=A0AA95HHG0_9GAMM|nr:MAG: transposase [Candidatus Thiothrix putei]